MVKMESDVQQLHQFQGGQIQEMILQAENELSPEEK